MVVNSTFLQYFISANPIVKVVMLLLLSASLVSWVFIFQRYFYFKWIGQSLKQFEMQFWQEEDLMTLYQVLSAQESVEGIEKIFVAGFREFTRLKQRKVFDPLSITEGVQRAMKVARMQATDELEYHLTFLATVGSTSPYVGLFGTVWGIMTAFHALGDVQQATISMVAPGISEALVATAMGLFAAIPAVVAYNRYSNEVERILSRYEAFEEEFINYLSRQLQAN